MVRRRKRHEVCGTERRFEKKLSTINVPNKGADLSTRETGDEPIEDDPQGGIYSDGFSGIYPEETVGQVYCRRSRRMTYPVPRSFGR